MDNRMKKTANDINGFEKKTGKTVSTVTVNDIGHITYMEFFVKE